MTPGGGPLSARGPQNQHAESPTSTAGETVKRLEAKMLELRGLANKRRALAQIDQARLSL